MNHEGVLPASKAEEISLATAAEFVSYSEIREDGSAVTSTETTSFLSQLSALLVCSTNCWLTDKSVCAKAVAAKARARVRYCILYVVVETRVDKSKTCLRCVNLRW